MFTYKNVLVVSSIQQGSIINNFSMIGAFRGSKPLHGFRHLNTTGTDDVWSDTVDFHVKSLECSIQCL